MLRCFVVCSGANGWRQEPRCFKTLLVHLRPSRGAEVANRGARSAPVSLRARRTAHRPCAAVPNPPSPSRVESVLLNGPHRHGNLFTYRGEHRTVAARVLESFGLAHLAPAPLHQDLRSPPANRQLVLLAAAGAGAAFASCST